MVKQEAVMQRGDQEINRCVMKSGTDETLCSLNQALNTNDTSLTSFYSWGCNVCSRVSPEAKGWSSFRFSEVVFLKSLNPVTENKNSLSAQ